MNKAIAGLAMIAACGAGSSAWAADGLAVEIGRGDHTDMARVSLTRQWDTKWFTAGNWHLTGYWELALGRWKSDEPGGKGVWDLGVTPVFRLQPNAEKGMRPYVEGAVGAHLISRTRIDNGRNMSTAFQFGDHVGVGIVFGERGQYDLAYRYQHLSNADIKKPNPGIDFHQLRLAYQF